VVALQKILPGVPNSDLRTGISIAFNTVQANAKVVAVTV
jgi:hypothetical protein